MFVDEIEGVVEANGLTFRYGNPAELNSILDKISQNDYPLLVYIAPITATDTIESSGLVKTSFPFTAAVLKQHKKSTIDYDSSIVQTTIDECREIARAFISSLNKSSFIDPETNGITSVSYPSLYSEYDAHLMGVSIQTTIPAQLNSTYC